MNLLNSVLLSATGSGGGLGIGGFLPFILIIVVFYFFMIRPQMRKQKELKKFRDQLAKGDKVVTTGGIYGRIAEVKETYIVLDTGNNVSLKVDKAAIIKDMSDIERK